MAHTIQEICERFRVTEHTVLAWIHTGDLRAVNVAPVHGKRPKWRVSAKALEDFERLRTTYPPPKPPAKRQARRKATAGDRY